MGKNTGLGKGLRALFPDEGIISEDNGTFRGRCRETWFFM